MTQVYFAACSNCETGKLIPGTYGFYCFQCETFVPRKSLESLVDRFMDETDEDKKWALDCQLAEYIYLTVESCRSYLARQNLTIPLQRTKIASNLLNQGVNQ